MHKLLLLLSVLLITEIGTAQTWQSVGNGTNNSSHGMINWNGQLINLGSFNNPCNRVARWTGSSWVCLGGGVGIVARDATVWQGNLIVVGDFWNVQQPCVGCNGVAMWDGTSWTPLGTGVNNDVLTCTVWNNELVIAGDFTQAGGQPISRIAKWNGTAWQGIGTPSDFTNDIRAMVEFDGELWVGGDFNNVAGCSSCDGLVKWDAATTTWVGGNSGVDLVGGVDESVRVLYVNPNDGNLYMGGEFPELWDGDALAENFNMSGIAMYDGSNWTPLGTGLNEYCRAIHEYNGNIIAGGYFTTAGGVPANKIAKWNGTSWSAMGLGFDAVGIDEYVKSAAVWNGIFFAGGAYTQAEGNPMNYIAQWYEPPAGAPVAWINSSSSTLCGSGCIDFLDNSTNNPTSWNWTFAGANIPTSTAQFPGSICWSAPGTYTVSLQACNAIGCTTQNMTVTVTNGATVSANDAAICGGGPATLTAVPSAAGGTFLWTPGGQTTASISVNPATTTNYTVTYSYLGCTSSDVSTVSVGTGSNVTISGGTSVCQGQSITLTATPSSSGGTYLWSPGGQTTQSITVSPTSTTNYSVEYTLNGCTSSPVVQAVNVTATPTVTVPDATICGGGSTTLVATPSAAGGSYLWSPGGQTTSSVTVSPGSTTNYSVVYTLNGCASTPDQALVSVNTTPTLTATNQTICQGQSVTLSPTPSASGGTYLWSPGGQTTPTITVSPSSTTAYSVNYTLNGCTSPTQNINVTVNSVPSVTVNNPAVCAGQSVTLTATPSAGGGTYLWTPGNQNTSSITLTPASTTTYSVVYTLNGCSDTEQSSVTVHPTYNQTQNVTVCMNTVYTYPDGFSETVTGATSHTSSLTTAAGCDSIIVTNVNGVNAISTSETIPLCAGANYTYPDGTNVTNVTANESHVSTLLSGGGCDSIVTTYLVVSPTPDDGVTVLDNILTADENGATYQWLDCNNGLSPINGATDQSFAPTQNGAYAVQVTLNGCTTTSLCSDITTIGLIEMGQNGLLIYPNPADEFMELEGEGLGIFHYSIFDATGRRVLDGNSETGQKIRVAELSPGMYLIEIADLGQYRFVKE